MSQHDLERKGIAKLQVQLSHAMYTALANSIRMAGSWDSTSQSIIDDIIRNCDCLVAFPPELTSKLGDAHHSLRNKVTSALTLLNYKDAIIRMTLTNVDPGQKKDTSSGYDVHTNRRTSLNTAS